MTRARRHCALAISVLAVTGVVRATDLAGGASPVPAAPVMAPHGGIHTTSAARADRDRDFVEAAARIGRERIDEARAALRHATREDVRAAARRLLDEQRESLRRLEAVATRKGWELPATSTTPAALASADVDIDRNYAGRQFDALQRMIDVYRAQARSGTDPDLRTYARATLPTLEHHLEVVRALRQDVARPEPSREDGAGKRSAPRIALSRERLGYTITATTTSAERQTTEVP